MESTSPSVSTHTEQHKTGYLGYFVDTQRNAKQQPQSSSVPRPHMHQRYITVRNNCYFSLCYCNADRLIHRVPFIEVSYPYRAYWLRGAPPVWHSTTVRSAHTLFMCFVLISEQTATSATYSINWLVFITEIKSVYSEVRTGSLYKAVCASSVKGS